MKTMLLACAACFAACAFAAPAGAQALGESAFANGSGGGGFGSGDRHRRHRDPPVFVSQDPRHFGVRRHDGVPFEYYNYYPQDFDGNRAFDPEKYNDWWHERPHRSYPRWVWSNQNCERQWQGGGTWRCAW